jgi:hypothetical protein
MMQEQVTHSTGQPQVLYSHLNATASAIVQDVAIAACTRLPHHHHIVVLLV